jgi:hypothetical protein
VKPINLQPQARVLIQDLRTLGRTLLRHASAAESRVWAQSYLAAARGNFIYAARALLNERHRLAQLHAESTA